MRSKSSKLVAGDRFKTPNGLYCTVIEYINHKNVLIEFDNGGTRTVSNRRLKIWRDKWCN